MENEDARRSDRVPVELPIVVTGTDAMGAGFLEQTRTIMVGRHGAKILLSRKLAPEQEINIRCLKTARESDARIVGQLGSEGESYYYGVELLEVESVDAGRLKQLLAETVVPVTPIPIAFADALTDATLN